MKKLISLLLAAAMLLSAIPFAGAANYSSWFRSSYEEMNDLGILPDSFRNMDLTQPITRLEMCTLTVKAFEEITGNIIEPARKDYFTDTQALDALKAYECGIVGGYPDGTFRPNANITRQEFFKVILNFCQSAAFEPDSSGASLAAFRDGKDVDAWAVDAAKTCVKYYYIQGAQENGGTLALNPKSGLTRQEAMVSTLRCHKGLSEYYYYVKNAQVVALAAPGSKVTENVTVTDCDAPVSVTTTALNVRKLPTASSDKLGTLGEGESVKITGVCSNGWLRIDYRSGVGYVSGDYLKFDNPAILSQVASSLAVSICNQAMQYVGYRYVWGGTSPKSGFDCSGLVYYVYRNNGIQMNRVADDQMNQGQWVSYDNLLAGDLVFFGYGDYADHVGIYIGNGNFLHAANPSAGVRVSSMKETYYAKKYLGAKRVITG
ncbi:MAG: C40 family peptidase [Oscillospiraceae bacterium]|nr:C40 family peptidase [Oscillospiraceae bacterium]